MFKRVVIIGSATALAGLVLFLAMRADPAARPEPMKSIDAPLDPSAFTAIDPDADGRPAAAFDPRGQADKYRINRHNESGQLIEFFGDRITPRPKGVADVTAPGARIHLAKHRVLQITADNGTIVAPDNQPQSGQFTGNVEITLFESSPDRAVDLAPDSADIALRARLGDSRFDLDLGLIESNQAIHVTSAQLDFRGTGLTLSYNERRRRIDRLEIHQGRSLRFKPHADGSGGAGPTTDNATNDHGGPIDATRNQRYRASFNKRVHIKTPQAQVDADSFDVVFNFNPRPGGGPVSRRTPTPGTAHSDSAPVGDAGPAATALPAATADQAKPVGMKSMAPVGPDDIIITWSGPLTVTPDTQTSADELDRDEALIELAGRPLTITTPTKHRISAAKLDYLTTTARLRAFADGDNPVDISSPALGRLTAQALVFSQADGTGRITGPGTLEAADTLEGDSSPVLAIAGSKIAWENDLVLAFTPISDGDQADAGDPFARFASLDTADFDGRVRLVSTDLNLACDHLTVGIDNTRDLPPAPKAVVALGDVHLTAQDARTATQPLDVRADKLRIDLIRDDGHRAQPDTIVATGSVDARHTGRRIRSDRLRLTVGADPNATGAAADLPIRTVTADHNVRIDIDDPRIAVTADRLTADIPADQIELFAATDTAVPQAGTLSPSTPNTDALADWPIGIGLGNPEDRTPAQVWVAFDQGYLRSGHLVLHQRTQSLHVPGAGSLAFIVPNSRRDNGAGPGNRSTSLIEKAIAASRNTEPTGRETDPPIVDRAGTPGGPVVPDVEAAHAPAVTIGWTQAMHLDSRSGVAQFVGDVRVRSTDANNSTELEAQDLRLEFAEPLEPKASAAGTGTATPVDRLAVGDRTIHTATARDNVVLTTQRFDPKRSDPLQTRLRLQGPHVVFDHAAEQAQVLGGGSLLFEDYRAERASADTPRIRLTGRGATLFRWDDQMTIDAAHNDVELLGGVQMLHRPIGGRPVQLDCRRLLADLQPTGGLPSWLTGRRHQPSIRTIHADSDVRLTASDRSVRTDKLLYTGADNTVLLQAGAGRLTLLHEHDQPYVHSAQAFRWFLSTDRIEIDNPTSASIPLPGGVAEP